MRVSVLAEGNFDGMFLATLIADEQHRYGIEVKVAGGLASLYSVARTLLAVKRTPVAVVIDAETPEPEAADERRRSAEELLGDAAADVPFRVLVAIPVLEALFFQRPELVRRVFGDAADDHLIELAQLSPRHALRKLRPNQDFHKLGLQLLKTMDADDIRAIRDMSPIRELIAFIEQVATSPLRMAASKA